MPDRTHREPSTAWTVASVLCHAATMASVAATITWLAPDPVHRFLRTPMLGWWYLTIILTAVQLLVDTRLRSAHRGPDWHMKAVITIGTFVALMYRLDPIGALVDALLFAVMGAFVAAGPATRANIRTTALRQAGTTADVVAGVIGAGCWLRVTCLLVGCVKAAAGEGSLDLTPTGLFLFAGVGYGVVLVMLRNHPRNRIGVRA